MEVLAQVPELVKSVTGKDLGTLIGSVSEAVGLKKSDKETIDIDNE